MPSRFVQELFRRLDGECLRYCHWKSNWDLPNMLEARGDIDLLVHEDDASKFESIVSAMRFLQARPDRSEGGPFVRHYYAHDAESNGFVHVHLYTRIISGGSILKNYRLPVESRLLGDCGRISGVAVPSRSVELLVFAIRKMLEHTSLIELRLLLKDYENVRKELRWLLSGDTVQEMGAASQDLLPGVSPDLLLRSVKALAGDAPLYRRIGAALELRRRCARFRLRRMAGPVRTAIYCREVIQQRLLGRKPSRRFVNEGGYVIAVTGPEASGKSTIVAAIGSWLGEQFVVRTVHAGKPPATLLSFGPRRLIALGVWLKGIVGGGHQAGENSGLQGSTSNPIGAVGFSGRPLVRGVLSLLDAYDRSHLVRKAFRKTRRGTIVVCDRYPGRQPGEMDGPNLAMGSNVWWLGPLRRLEELMYARISPADVTLRLHVPLDLALRRNAARAKNEPDEYVRARHAQFLRAEHSNPQAIPVCTEGDLEDVVREVRRAIWGRLCSRA